ncbi:DUF2569 domain-containing protein [Salmonella enterica]|nr:DUF2569 domain-containing protein [Salmonella enterica]
MKCINCRTEEPNHESGLCDACEDIELQQINGLLYLPAMGLLINSVMSLVMLYTFTSDIVAYYGHNGYVSDYAIGIVVFLVVNIPVSLITAWRFFRRKKGITRNMIIYYVFNFILALYLVVLPVIIFHVPVSQVDIKTLAASVAGVVIWIPYFIFSRRIAVVFSR